MDALPLILIEPPGPTRDRILESAAGSDVKAMDSLEAFQSWEEESDADWGIVLLGPGLSPQVILAFLESQAQKSAPWSSLRIQEVEGGFKTRGLSQGPPQPLEAVLEMAQVPDEKGPALELHWALKVVAKARHDLNNPLTAGLAEVQLLLMDDHGPEVNEALEVIQTQFRRLRDMVAELSRLRVPQKPGSR